MELEKPFLINDNDTDDHDDGDDQIMKIGREASSGKKLEEKYIFDQSYRSLTSMSTRTQTKPF